MSRNRLFPCQETDELVKRATFNTSRLCQRYGVMWDFQYRQRDMLMAFHHDFGVIARSEAGLCQILVIMYDHIRDLFIGRPDTARRFFAYWCARDRISAQRLLQPLAATINMKQILEDYLDSRGAKSLITVTNQFWEGVSLRRQSTLLSNKLVSAHFYVRTNARQQDFAQYIKCDMSSTLDFDFVRELNPNYLLKRNNIFVYLHHYQELAQIIVSEWLEIMQEEIEVRCHIQLANANNPKIETQHMIGLYKLSDSNQVELVDANRGIFLFPQHDKERLQGYLTDYLKLIYRDFNFNRIHIETFVKVTPDLNLDVVQKLQLEAASERNVVKHRLTSRASL